MRNDSRTPEEVDRTNQQIAERTLQRRAAQTQEKEEHRETMRRLTEMGFKMAYLNPISFAYRTDESNTSSEVYFTIRARRDQNNRFEARRAILGHIERKDPNFRVLVDCVSQGGPEGHKRFIEASFIAIHNHMTTYPRSIPKWYSDLTKMFAEKRDLEDKLSHLDEVQKGIDRFRDEIVIDLALIEKRIGSFLK